MKAKTPTAVALLFLLASSAWAGGDPFRRMSKELSAPLLKMKDARVGLLVFPYHDGRLSSGSSIICERLTTSLASTKGIRVVERRLIQKLLEEQKLNETGVIDPKTAQKMGQLLGIDIIVTGTLIDLDHNLTEVNARALMSDTVSVSEVPSALLR
jgi:curli biogenesis system outer membrane secretion channel CsgG